MFLVVCLSVHERRGGESCGAVHALPDMFKLGLGLRCTGTPPVPDMFKKFVHYVAHTVGKAGGWHSTEMPSFYLNIAFLV